MVNVAHASPLSMQPNSPVVSVSADDILILRVGERRAGLVEF